MLEASAVTSTTPKDLGRLLGTLPFASRVAVARRATIITVMLVSLLSRPLMHKHIPHITGTSRAACRRSPPFPDCWGSRRES
jgi:hypothetical protein